MGVSLINGARSWVKGVLCNSGYKTGLTVKSGYYGFIPLV